MIEEKIVKRDTPGATPDPSVLRVAKANLVEHMLYFNWLFATRQWYARIKSRPAFRTLLTDRVGGMPPHAGYADLDF